MTPEALEKLCQDARKRLAQFVNRSTGQHLRAMRRAAQSARLIF